MENEKLHCFVVHNWSILNLLKGVSQLMTFVLLMNDKSLYVATHKYYLTNLLWISHQSQHVSEL